MSTCSTCGASKNSTLKIVLWCVGLGLVGLVGLPFVMIILLAAVAAVGSQADSKFETDGSIAPVSQVSQPAEESVLNASNQSI